MAVSRIAAALICALWGGGVVALKVALEEIPPFLTGAIKTGLSTCALLGWIWLSRGSFHIPRCQAPLIALAGLFLAGHIALVSLALSRTEAAHVSVLVYLYPLFTAVLAHWCLPGERVRPTSALGLLIAFAGSTLTVMDETGDGSSGTLVGDGLAIGSGCLWALSTICTKRISTALSPLLLAFYPTLAAMITFLLLSLSIERHESVGFTMRAGLALLYLGLVLSALCGVAWIALLKRLHARSLAAYTFLSPVCGVLASAAILGESPGVRLFVGLGLVVCGLTLTSRSGDRGIADDLKSGPRFPWGQTAPGSHPLSGWRRAR